MKKISTLCLTLVMLLMVMMHVAPNAQAAEGEKAELTYTIVNETNPNGTNSATVEVTLGNKVGINLGDDEKFGYYIHAGDMITDPSQTFIASASNHVVVVMKESKSHTVATFVDTNGEFLGAIYNPTSDSDPESLEISVSKPGFNFVGFDDLEAGVDKVYVAKYSRANQEEINVNITGGSKDLEVVQYNDVVTLTPNAGNFSYWADSDGQVVSRQANYKFTALQDVELTAVFDDSASSEPVVYLSNVTGISPDTKSFLGYVEGDFIEYGLLASDKEEVLTLETEDVTVIPSKALHPETNEFLRSIPNDTNLKSFRAYAKLASGEVFYSENNFLLVNLQSHSFDFENGHGNSYGSGPTYLQTYDYENLLDGSTVKVNFLRTSNNTGGGLTNALVISPRGNQGDGKAYAEFDLTGATRLDFEVVYWNSEAEQYFDSFIIQELYGNEWVDVYDILPFIEGTTTIKMLTAELSGNIFRFYATGGESDGNKARVLIDNLKVYREIDNKLLGISFINEELSEFVSVVKGETINQTINTDRLGKLFNGWFENEDLTGNQFNFETTIDKHLVLYASYSDLPEFTVTFDLNGGSGEGDYGEIKVYQGYTINLPENPSMSGYVFSGWFTDPGIWENKWDANNGVEQNLELYAYWIEESEVEPVVLSLTWLNVSDSNTQGYMDRTWIINELVFTANKLTRNGSKDEYTIQGNSSNSSGINSPELGLIQEIAIRVPNTGSSASTSAKWYIEVAGNSEFINSTKYGFGSGYSNTPNVDFSGHSSTVNSTNVLTLKDTSVNTPSFVLDVSGDNARFVRFVWESGATYIAQIDITYIPQ